MTQEAYARAWRRWRTVQTPPRARGVGAGGLTRLATDRWRRLRGLRVALERSGPPVPVHPPSEDTVLLVRALRQLPVRQRQALALYYPWQ